MCLAPQRRALFRHLNVKKVSEPRNLFILLTWKRHNSVHFFDIWTSKSGPNMWCFVHFELEMCFAAQQRAIFHLSSDDMAPHPPLLRGYFSTPLSHKSLEKQRESRLSYLFAHLPLLSSLSLSSLIFSFLLLSAFPTVHIVGSFTSKLPSIISRFPENFSMSWWVSSIYIRRNIRVISMSYPNYIHICFFPPIAPPFFPLYPRKYPSTISPFVGGYLAAN